MKQNSFNRLVLVACAALTFSIGLTSYVSAQATAEKEAPAEQEKADQKSQEASETKTDAANKDEGEFDVELQLKTFDTVWSEIKRVHWDPEKVGEKWDAAKEKFRPQVAAAKSVDETRAILNQLINTLGQSHFGIIPAESYEAVGDDGDNGKGGDTGLTFRQYKDGIMVTAVRKDSAGHKAGVEPGWMVNSMDGNETSDLIAKIEKAAHGPVRAETLIGMVSAKKTEGAVGDEREFVFTDNDGKTKEIEIELGKAPGRVVSFGGIKGMRVSVEARTMEDGIGYYRFSSFFDPVKVMGGYAKAINDEKHQSGMIIDLRGNPGGIAGMTMGMASALVEENVELGVMKMKGATVKFTAVAKPIPYPGRVAILVDECSVSSSEIFAGGLQDLKVARVFGSRTAGLALPSTVSKLPNGDGFQFAIADYHSKSGKVLEMDGVLPDEVIEITPELLKEFRDPVLNRAIKWIQEESKKK